MPELETFEKFIQVLPKDAKVLDVGVAGVGGENTSDFLSKHFNRVLGVTIDERGLAMAQNRYKNYDFIHDNFYNRPFEQKFDLLVLDLTIESNLLNDWSDKGLERAYNLIKPGGFLINFVMATDQYGDPDITPDLIRWHSKRWWKSDTPTTEAIGKKLEVIKGFKLHVAAPELRRPYIYWVMLQRDEK